MKNKVYGFTIEFGMKYNEINYLRSFLRLFCIRQFTTLQEFIDNISHLLLGNLISSFIVISDTIKTRRTSVRGYSIDFKPIVTSTSDTLPMSVLG